jgi:hypothetical protein
METKFNTNELLRICVKNQINDLNIIYKHFFAKFRFRKSLNAFIAQNWEQSIIH